MILSFIFWSQTCFQNQDFIIAGVTAGTLKRNVIDPMLKLLDTLGSQFKIAPMAEAIIPESLAIRSLIAIEDNFQNAKISDIAEKLYVNSGHLGKIFKAELGLTISDYLIMRKIAEAKRLLYTGLSVKEACHLSGFGNYSNFIRTFKKIEGYPPGKFEINSEPIS